MKNIWMLLLLFLPQVVKAQDSLFTTVDMDRVYLLHIVKEKETMYSITRRYMVDLTSLIAANPSIKESYISSGQKLIIPFNFGVAPADTLPVLRAKYQPVYHIMQPRESLASLKRMYGFSMATFRLWNTLKSDTIAIGKRMIVNWVNKDENYSVQLADHTIQNDSDAVVLQKPIQTIEVKPVTPKPNANLSPREKYQQLKNVGVEVKEDGFGKWFEGDDSGADFCLHKDLPRGTIIKLTNFMNGRIKYLKVVGNLPPSGENHDIIVRISSATARQLDILDKKFKCTIEHIEN